MTQALRMLLAENLITFDQLDHATAMSAARGGSVDHHLVRSGAIDEEQLARFLVRRFPVQLWTRNRLQTVSDLAIAAVPARLAHELHVVPVALEDRRLILALTDPSRRHAIEEIAHHTGRDVTPAVVTHSDLEWALAAFYHGQPVIAPVPPAPAPPPGLPLDEAVRAIPLMHVKSKPDGRYGAALGVERDSGRARVEILHLPSAPAPSCAAFGSPVSAAAIVPATGNLPPEPPRETMPAIPTRPPAPMKPVDPPLPERAPALDSWSSPPPPRNSPVPAEPEKTSEQPPPPRSEGVLMAAIGSAVTRDEIISLALEYLRRFAGRAVFMAVKKKEIRGMDIAGAGTNRESIRSFWVPVAARSTLSRVVSEGRLHLGPLSRHPADGVLAAAMGGRPDRALILPVTIKDRVVALLYADELKVDLPPGQRLVRLAEAVADGFARLISGGA